MNEARDGLPAGWQWATLGELVDRLQYGYTASAVPGADGPRFLRITDLQEEGISWEEVPGCAASGDDIAKYELRDGDVVFARTGSIEKAAVVRNPPQAVFASYLIRGRPTRPGLSNWIGHFVRSRHYLDQIGAAGAGIGRQNVNATKLGAVRIPIAPEAEQRRIVAKLDELLASSRAARAALDAVPALLEQYRQSLLASAFRGDLTASWRANNAHRPVGDALLEKIDAELADVSRHRRAPDRSGVDPVVLPAIPDSWRWADAGRCTRRLTVGHVGPMQTRYKPGGVPFLRSQNVRENRIDRAGLQFIPQDFHEDLVKSRLEPGDVVIVRSGAPGTAAVVPSDFPDANCSDLVIARFSDLILPELIVRFINSRQCRERIFDRQVGVAQQHFNVGAMRTLPIPIMPLEEQEQLLRIIREREAAMEVVRERTEYARKQLDDLNAAALGKAFLGELVPQDPADEPAEAALARLSAGGPTPSKGRRRSRASHRA